MPAKRPISKPAGIIALYCDCGEGWMEDVKDESKNWKEDPALQAIHNANMAKKGLSLLNKLDNLEMWSKERAIWLS